MIFFQNLYCGECRRCIGFQNGAQPLPTLYCLECEDAVRKKEVERQELQEQYRGAVARAFCDAR